MNGAASGPATRYTAARKKVLEPFEPYDQYAGTDQSWHMFVAPHRNPARLYIDLSNDSGQPSTWRLLYVSRHPELRWKSEVFDHSRGRAALFRYSWRHYRAPIVHLEAEDTHQGDFLKDCRRVL